MILTGNEIESSILSKKICIEPFIHKNINPNSYNYRLSEYIATPQLDDKTGSTTYKTIKIPSQGFMLQPHITYLSHTYEKIGSSEYAMSLIGRSSLGRLGLFLQVSADLGHTKSCHKWTLEIVSCKKFIIYPMMVIGQVSFWRNEGDFYESIIRYNKFNFLSPTINKYEY